MLSIRREEGAFLEHAMTAALCASWPSSTPQHACLDPLASVPKRCYLV